MYCTNCGKEIEDHVKFCPECGCSMDGSVRPTDEESIQPTGMTDLLPQVEKQTVPILFGTCRLVIGIVSIVLCIVVLLQSCAVGMVNLFEDSGSASGTAGMILAVPGKYPMIKRVRIVQRAKKKAEMERVQTEHPKPRMQMNRFSIREVLQLYWQK